MKTPDRITLIYEEQEAPRYNPKTGEYEVGERTEKIVPCLAHYQTARRTFEEYGNREERVLVVRFSQEQEPFTRAVYKGKDYIPVESVDVPIKSAIRLRRVSDVKVQN